VATNVSSTALTTDRGPANQAMVAVMIPGRGEEPIYKDPCCSLISLGKSLLLILQ